MNNQEAIKILDNLKPGDYSNPYEKGEAIVMAISALQAQDSPKPIAESVQNVQNEDLISRKAAIDATWEEPSYTDPINVLTEVRDKIKRLPSAQPNLQPICNQLATDTISRQAAISELMEWVEKEKNKSWSPFKGLFHWTGIKAMLECLPSAQPEIVMCKDCEHWLVQWNFCTRNGCYMFEDDYCSKPERRTDE